MFQSMRIVLYVLFVVLVAGCGGSGSSSDSGAGTGAESSDAGSDSGSTMVSSNPWIGSWSLVSENGAAGSGQLTLNAGSFSQTSSFEGGTCTWTGSVSNVTATNLTISTATAAGPPQCSNAIGRSASPTWSVSSDNNRLTLDYRGAITFGTVQVWQRN